MSTVQDTKKQMRARRINWMLYRVSDSGVLYKTLREVISLCEDVEGKDKDTALSNIVRSVYVIETYKAMLQGQLGELSAIVVRHNKQEKEDK